MLQVTIKDTKTNDFIYDEEVSMVIMQATEKKQCMFYKAYDGRRRPI